MINLRQAPSGARVKLISIQGGRTMVRRLLALGLSVGNELDIVHHRGHGIVVARDGNRVALGGGVAERMMAEVLKP